MEVMKHGKKDGKKEEERDRRGRCKGGLCRGTETERMQNEREYKKNLVTWLREREEGGRNCAEKANRDQ